MNIEETSSEMLKNVLAIVHCPVPYSTEVHNLKTLARGEVALKLQLLDYIFMDIRRPARGCRGRLEALLFAMYYFLIIASFIFYYIYLYRL